MHQALYRKYRPKTFSDVCGQDHISNTLKNQISENRFTHAYLFTGSRGTGKTSSAKILSKAVNCLNPQNGDPCNECENCVGIDNGEILDVVEIDAASNNGVEDIRNLRDQVEYLPSKAKFRVYIIDEVHMLSKPAFNALLKTLEEPPAHVIFILATTEVWAIPTTILSRCQRYDFNRISAEVISDRVKYICDKENLKIEDNAATLIAKLCDGGMRDALSLLDLCAGTDSNITEALVASSSGLVGKEHLFKITDIIVKGDATAAINTLDELYNASCDMERLMNELIAHFRDLLVAKTANDANRLITGTNEDIERIIAQAKNIKFEKILYCTKKFSECLDTMKKGTSKRIAAETTLIRLCTDELDLSSDAVLKRLGDLENKLSSISLNQSFVSDSERKETVTPELKKESVKTAPITEKPKKSNKNNSAEEAVKFTKWAEALEIIKAESTLLYMVLVGSKAYIKGQYLLIDAKNPAFSETLNNNEKHRNDIRSAVFKITGENYRLGPYNEKTAVKHEESDKLEELISNFSEDITIEG